MVTNTSSRTSLLLLLFSISRPDDRSRSPTPTGSPEVQQRVGVKVPVLNRTWRVESSSYNPKNKELFVNDFSKFWKRVLE